MATKWTDEQKLAIESSGSNILVAAAAGSGKTAVLVERIIKRIVDYKVDIDKLLVVTFTNAAASEMRQRVLDAIYKKLEENPDDLHMQKQLILMNKSNICTIHSFCLDVIKNNFFEIDVSPNFRIASEEELELLRRDCLEEIFENLYEEKNEEFTKLIEIYTSYQSDDELKNMVLEIYKFIQSSPFPEEWLEKAVEEFNLEDKLNEDFSKNKWGEILLREYREELEDSINGINLILNKTSKYTELEKYILVLKDDISQLEEALKYSSNWDSAFENAEKIKFKSWPVDKKVTMELKDQAKDSRDLIKKKFMAKKKKILLYDSVAANKDIFEMYNILVMLKTLIFKFSEEYAKRKREKNIIDFNDIEHMALKILVKVDENGEKVPTEIAKRYREKFFEIAIDEYQDSNYVQEYILNSISKNNIFMVGDMKQSIYKFRQASPEIFLAKYEKYNLVNEEIEDGLKIKLFKNFRSRENVLNVTNLIFENIMSKRLGDIDYTEEEFLNTGRIFDTFDRADGKALSKAELNIIDLKKDDIDETNRVDTEENDKIEYDEKDNKIEDSNDSEGLQEEKDRIENATLEALLVSKKIDEIINGNYYVFDKKKGYRKVEYRDIVILLRTTSNVAPIYEKTLTDSGFPVFSDSSKQYLDTIEIQTIISLLKIIDNPTNEIPLVAILRSEICNFTDNEILEIRLIDKNINFYYALKKYQEIGEKQELKDKIKILLEKLDLWRNASEYLGLDELIWKIYIDTGFFDFVRINAWWRY